MIKKALAGAGIALALLIATPLAANAYAPAPPPAISDSTVTPGQTVTVAFTGFASSEGVSFTLTGENAAGATLAAISSKTVVKAASATGATTVAITPPANASGTYSLTATGLESGIIGTAALAIVDADGNPISSLASTGGTLPIAAIWIASGVVVLGLVLLAVVGIRRRSVRTN